MDHSSLHWIITIKDHSGSLIRWKLRLADFDLNVTYKKGKDNMQSDALWSLTNVTETIPHDEIDIIFLLDETYLGPEIKRSPDEIAFIDFEYNDVDELCNFGRTPTTTANFELIGV